MYEPIIQILWTEIFSIILIIQLVELDLARNATQCVQMKLQGVQNATFDETSHEN